MSIAINKKVKFDGARCPFSTFLRLQGDHHCACAQKWCHFSFFSKSFQTKKKIKALRPKMTKNSLKGGGPALIYTSLTSRGWLMNVVRPFLRLQMTLRFMPPARILSPPVTQCRTFLVFWTRLSILLVCR